MLFDSNILLYGAVFIGVLLLVEGAYYLLRDWRLAPANAVNRRLRLLAGSDRRTVLRRLRRDDQNPASCVLKLAVPAAERLLIESGSTSTLSRLASIVSAIAVWTFLPLHHLLLLPLAQSILIAIGLAFALPLASLMIKRRKRLRRFGEQLPDAIDVLVRSLRAGHPVSGAMGLVAEEMPDPVGTEFGLCVDEMTYGLSVEQAMSNMAGRVPQSDLSFLVIAIQVQHSSGGDLAEILGNLATVIRDRSRMYAKISAVSAEGKLAARVIGALPFLVFGALNVVAPSFFGDVYSDALFAPLIGVAFILWVFGIVIFMKMVRIKV